MITYLISKSSTNKIRIVYLFCSEKWDDELGGYVITRTTGQYKGKMTSQPNIVIQHGKAKRTTREQLELEYSSNKKKYLDKGYKEINKDPDTMTEEELNEILGDIKTDANGFSKHMLAKQSNDVSEKTINKLPYWYASYKLDGVRASFYWNGKEIKTASRGGGNYDMACWSFLDNEEFKEFFKRHPDWTLDGELYKHGRTLQFLSGEARRASTVEGSSILEYYIYDVMIPNVPFEERLEVLNQIKSELHLGFDPYREWNKGELRIQILEHTKVHGLEEIDKFHDAAVALGFEGAVMRDPSKEYGFGKRDARMIKRKKFVDDEFKILGISEGLREEDMCFILETKDHKEFKAKPIGDRALKEYYREHIDEIIGKMGTIKYFYYSNDGIPTLPVFKHIRPDGE